MSFQVQNGNRLTHRPHQPRQSPHHFTGTIKQRPRIKRFIMTDRPHRGGSLHIPSLRTARNLSRRRGGAIGSDLGVGAATVGIPLAIFLAKKIYDWSRK